MANMLWLIAGGVTGTLARHFCSVWIGHRYGTHFPYGTLFVNLLGCFLIGFFGALLGQKGMSSQAKLLLITGFCGAFTTFSTFMLETSVLLKSGNPFGAFLNLFGSFVLGFLFFRVGTFAANLF